MPSLRFASARATALAALALAGGAAVAYAGTIDPAIAARLDRPAQSAQRPIAVIIELDGRPDLASIASTLGTRPASERQRSERGGASASEP